MEIKKIKRAPIVAIMGHIDHGKSTLLSYIRKNLKPLNEAGGITQHISSYEIIHKNEKGENEKITFLDTPGHEAFRSIRKRGAKIADIAVLVVSSEDGVKPQTLEALKFIKESETPFIVAITKIDKPEANIEKTKISLAENEIYIEGYGGTIPSVEVSAKTGAGVNSLLDMILLISDIDDLHGYKNVPAEGVIIESNKDSKNGITATCVIKNGTMKIGNFIVSGNSMATVRTIENCDGKKITEASFSSPVRVFGFDSIPNAGEFFKSFLTKEEAISNKNTINNDNGNENINSKYTVPIVLKADTVGTLEALCYEIAKLNNDEISTKVIKSGVGKITEDDVKIASGNGKDKAIIIGFGVKSDSLAQNLSQRNETPIYIFDIIYKISEWLKEELIKRTPKDENSFEIKGVAKVLKTFSKVKDKQVVGCKMEEGTIKVGSQIKLYRRDEEIALGKVKSLQNQKIDADKIEADKEFGSIIECKIEIVQGDKIIVY